MIVKTECIVLYTFKYTGRSIIVHLFTQHTGRIACILNSVGGKKSAFKTAFFQPLSLLEAEIDIRENRDLQRIKDVKVIDPLHHIKMDIQKSSIALFLGEVLFKTLREEGNYDELFQFLKSSVLDLEKEDGNVSQFHILFLFELLRYTGIIPQNNFSTNNCFLDISKGTFVSYSSEFTINKELSSFFSHLLDQRTLRLSNLQKQGILDVLQKYYAYHFSEFGTIKSLAVLRELFR